VTTDPGAERHQIDSLRQAIAEGARTLHAGVESVAIQDAARPLHEPELQSISRGIEVLTKAAWMLNNRIITNEWTSAQPFGHGLTRLLGEVDEQARVLRQPSVLDDPVLVLIAETAEDFAKGGRFRHLDGLASGESRLPTYLAWNGVQMETVRFANRAMDQIERVVFLRRTHTAALQGLERSLGWHLLNGQSTIWGRLIVHRAWLEPVAARADSALPNPIPLDMDGRTCNCQSLNYREAAIWVPVDK
jgi:hypothetical protein